MTQALDTPRIVTLPKFNDPRGNLSVIENLRQIPFDMRRVYWIYDVPGGRRRYGHAFKHQQELIVALSGCFDVVLNNGAGETLYRMDRAFKGLYVPAMTWRYINNFATNSVALVISSTSYDPDDYIEDFDQYLQALKLP